MKVLLIIEKATIIGLAIVTILWLIYRLDFLFQTFVILMLWMLWNKFIVLFGDIKR